MAQQYSTSALRSLWARYQCKAGGEWSSPTVFGKAIGGVPTILVPAFNALEQALEVSGYHPPHGDSVWAYNCRMIAGTSSYSLHSYGLAIDIDPAANPFTEGDPYSGLFKKHHVDAVLGIKTSSGRNLWAWGGNWSKPDRMHFQIDNTPTDCQPDWSTVPEPEEDDDVTPADIAAIAEAVEAKLREKGVKLERSDYNGQTLYAATIGEADKDPKGQSTGALVEVIHAAVTK